MVKGLVIPADSDQPIEEREFNSVQDYQDAVGGRIEAVDVPPLGVTIYVNEEGLLRSLPLNSRATFLWWYEVEGARQRAMLVGDAAVVGLPDANGTWADVPEVTVALLTAARPYVVIVQYDDAERWVPHPFPYEDYFEAVVWAMILTERVTGATAVKVVPLEDFEQLSMETNEDS